MKFGRYLDEQRRQNFAPWIDQCIDYWKMKRFLKERVLPWTLNFALRTPNSDSGRLTPPIAAFNGNQQEQQKAFGEMMQHRLQMLSDAEPVFLDLLNQQVQKLNQFFLEETDRLNELKTQTELLQSPEVSETSRASDDQVFKESRDILQAVVRLEKFIFLNFTGICKILKKHDKLSGLKISEAYLSRLTGTEFYKSVGLGSMKQELMETVSGFKGKGSLSQLDLSQSQEKQLSQLVSARVVDANGVVTNTGIPWSPSAGMLPSQKIIITMSGPHGTDIIGSLLENIAKYDVSIDDLMFSRLHHNVTCAILLRLKTENMQLFKDLSSSAQKWEAELRFDVYDERETLPRYLDEAPYANRSKYAATVLNQNGLSPKFLSEWTRLLLRYRISVETMKRLNDEGRVSVLDFRLSVPAEVDFDLFRTDLFNLCSDMGTDVALQPDDIYRRNKRLVIMDMDSTLIQQEVIDELAKHYGVMTEVAKITHRAMNGEIDFKESLRQRVSLLAGAPVTILDQVRDSLIFTEGAHALCKALKRLGYKLAVISGGFLPLANYVKNELGLDYAFANSLKVSADGTTLLGETIGPIVDAERKAELLEVIAQAEQVSVSQVVAIGDGANDLFMLAAAGLGIAFNAKPKVQQKARTRINQKSLRNVLYLLGYSDQDVTTLLVS